MYGKIFDSMYEGTLYGHWEAIVTLQQMLVLCNQDGVLDMTPQAIAARTSIPLDIITKGIEILAEVDPYSRTPDEDGRRIVLLDEHRPWGWRLVNYAKYQQIKNRVDKLEADRARIAEKRNSNKNKNVAECRKTSQSVAYVAPVTVAASVAVAETVNLPSAKAEGVTGVACSPASPPQLQLVTQAPAGKLSCPHERLISLYHEVLPTCPTIRRWNKTRKGYMQSRWQEEAKANGPSKGYRTVDDGIAYWRRFFEFVSRSRFLTGRSEGRNGGQPFVADLEWLIRPSNFPKVIEGKYHDEAA